MKRYQFILTSIFLISIIQSGYSQKNQGSSILDPVLATPVPSDAATLFITVLDIKTNLPVKNVNLQVKGNDGTDMNLTSDDEGKIKCLLYPYSFKFTYTHEKYRQLIESIKFTHAPDTLYLQKFIELK